MRNSVICIVSLVLGVCGLAQADLNDGLVAYYPFNGNANDESGNGNDGVVVGPFSFLNEKDYFTPNGNSRIEAPHLPSTNSYPITISARIRSSNPEPNAVIVSQYANGSWNGYELSGESSGFKGFFYRNSSNGIDFTTNEFEAGKWYSVVFTVAEDGGRLFVDGQLAGNESWSGEPVNATSTNPLIIGSREGFYANDIDIDDVRIYDRALSEDEVTSLYNLESAGLLEKVEVESYTYPQGPPSSYPDTDNVELIDGFLPSQGWGTGIGNDETVRYVGFLNTDADISFKLGNEQRLKKIRIFADDANNAGGVGYPTSVEVRTNQGYEETFIITDPPGVSYSTPIELNVDIVASEISLLIKTSNEWLMLGEIEFLGPSVPEFQIVEGNFTWQEAKEDAEAKGGRLAVIDSQAKQEALEASISDLLPAQPFHAGARKINDTWEWIDGSVMVFNNWGIGEPTEGEFLTFTTGGFPPTILNFGEWGNNYADKRQSYILEILERPPAAPVVDLDPFYESNLLEEIVVDATPSEGFPDNFTYQWSFNDFEVPAFLGGAEPILSLLGTSDQNGTWKVVVSNSIGSTEASFEYRMFEDNDADGISNYREENITLTDPDSADSDSDGLLDPEELFIHETDPNIADVDEDGLNDSEEIDAATDPRVADSDSDGLSDGLEVKTYSSNPNKADTDGDGIADAAEVAAGLDINAAENIADAVAFLIQELANRPPVDGFEDAIAEARASGRNDVTSAPSQYDLYEKEAYNAVVAERDARPTLAQYSEVLVERDARPSVVAYNAVIADRDSRPTKEAYDTIVSERDARPTLEEVKDGRLGSVLLLPDTATNKVRLRFCIEESNGLGQWITREEEAEVNVPLAPGKKFFRFSVKENE